MEAGADHVLPNVQAPLGQRHDVVAGQLRAVELLPAVKAQVRIAREQRGIGQIRGGGDRAGARMPAGGDDRVQVQAALQAGGAADAAVDVQAGVAQGPGDRATRVEAGGVLPIDPVEYAPVGVQGQ